MHGNVNAILRPQSDRSDRLYTVTRDKFEMKSSLNHGEQQRRLQHCEGCSHTDARTAAKRKIRKPRNFPRANRIFAPPLRIKRFGIRKETRIALRQELENKKIRAGSDTITANLAVSNGAASNAPNGRIKAHRFLEDHFRVAKARNIFNRRFAIAEHSAKFFDQPGFDIRILGNQKAGPGQSNRRRFVTSEKKRHHRSEEHTSELQSQSNLV